MKSEKIKFGKALTFAVLLAALAFVGVGIASAAIHCVNPSGIIQAEVDAASNSDTIEVASSTYYENVVVNKQLQDMANIGETINFYNESYKEDVAVRSMPLMSNRKTPYSCTSEPINTVLNIKVLNENREPKPNLNVDLGYFTTWETISETTTNENGLASFNVSTELLYGVNINFGSYGIYYHPIAIPSGISSCTYTTYIYTLGKNESSIELRNINGTPITNAKINISLNGNLIWTGRTDNNGVAIVSGLANNTDYDIDFELPSAYYPSHDWIYTGYDRYFVFTITPHGIYAGGDYCCWASWTSWFDIVPDWIYQPSTNALLEYYTPRPYDELVYTIVNYSTIRDFDYKQSIHHTNQTNSTVQLPSLSTGYYTIFGKIEYDNSISDIQHHDMWIYDSSSYPDYNISISYPSIAVNNNLTITITVTSDTGKAISNLIQDNNGWWACWGGSIYPGEAYSEKWYPQAIPDINGYLNLTMLLYDGPEVWHRVINDVQAEEIHSPVNLTLNISYNAGVTRPKSEIYVYKKECLSTDDTHINHSKIYDFTTEWSASLWEIENLDSVTYTITTAKDIMYIENWERYQNGTENTFVLPPTVEGQNYTWFLPLKDRVGSEIIFALDSPQTIQDNPWVDMDVNTTDEKGYTRMNITVVPVIPLDWINLDIRGEQIINVTTYPSEFEVELYTSSHIEFDSGEINQGQSYDFSILLEAPEEVYLWEEVWLDTTFDWIEEPPSDTITLPVAELGSVTVKADVPVIWEHSPTLPYYVQIIAIEFEEEKGFDTGAGTYPSIMGNHTGTIKPNQTITANKLYTYPCIGTGGHTEYARIWNSTLDVNATWNGYKGDWHNITFNKSFTLVANEIYNYTIRTGSYPQIHHTDELEVAGSMGTITCDKFIDANGKIYINWIPAIRLEEES